MDLMSKARAQMLLKHCFFGALVLSTKMVKDERIPTAYTNMVMIGYNPKFIESLATPDLVLFVLAHEVMHIVLKHGLRRGSRNPQRWNIACISDDSLIRMADGSQRWASHVRLGDELWSPAGPNRVLIILDRGVKEVVRLTHAAGECGVTLDHRFLTQRGFSDAIAKGSGLRQDILRVSRSERVRLSQPQDYVAPRHDGGDAGRIPQHRPVYVQAWADGGPLHSQAADDRTGSADVSNRTGVSGGGHRRRGDNHDHNEGSLRSSGSDDLEHLVPVARLAEITGLSAAHVLELAGQVVLEDQLVRDVSRQVPATGAAVSGDQSEARRSGVGVHFATSSAVERRAADGSYARDCLDLQVAESAYVDVRRTGEQRRTLDFVTEHHIYAVGDLICHNCDFAINLMLQKSGFTIWEHALCDAKYDGMSAEQIYDEREKERDERIRNGGSKGQKGKGKPGEGTADGGFDEDDGDGMGGDVGEPEAMDSATKAEIERSINQTVAQAASVARMQGKMPADLARLVDTILNPKVSWRELLQFYMTKVTHDDETWSRRDRRHQHVYLPGRDGSKSGEINIIVDTSGSIGDNDLAQVAAELREIAEVVKPERIRAIYVDAAVAGEQVFNEGEPVMLEARGGGGTDMRVGLEHVLKYDPAVVVMITDCATPWPDSEPAYPLITISTTKGECPWGQTVHYERES